MATISTRIDDKVKSDAERVAGEIGISLSTAINVFLVQFVSNSGFPFDVVVPKNKRRQAIIDLEQLDATVKRAIADSDDTGQAERFDYFDEKTNKLIKISRKEH